MSYLHDLYYQIYYYRKFNYHTSFGITLALEFFIRGATCLLVCIAIRKINEFALNSSAKPKEVPEKTEEPATSYFTNIPYYIFQVAFYLIKKFMTITHWVTSFLATLYLSLAPAFLHGFHLISFPTCMILMVGIYTFYFFSFVLRHVPIRKMKSEEGYKVYQRGALERWATVLKIAFLRYPIYYTVLALFCLSLAVSIPILLDEMCICFFCDYGLPFNHESKLSSRMMRKFMIPDACPPGKPCHVYTTLPEDGSTSIFINAHTSLETEHIKIYYDTLQNYEESQILERVSQPVPYKFGVEAKGARYVHSAYIGGLNENTEYYFEIHYGNEKQFSNKFKTLPSKGMERDLVIVSGGDVSSNERAQQMTENLIPLKPDVIFIDGDAAYDDGMASCYYSYDTFFNMFERLNEKLGYMVPLVIAAGNHDLGVNSMNLAPISRDVDGPPFFMFLPQHSTIGDTLYSVPAVPDLHSRKTYFYHLIGNMLHVSLDSGYDVEFGGSQAVWLDKISYSYSDYAKFAHQHVPIYPACEDEDDMPTREAELAAQVWTPIFENHNYLGVFENHVHLMKKTYPLKKGQVHSDGVIYFGDGNWGVAPHGCSAKNSPINHKLFEEVGEDSHVWIMHVNREGWEYYPLGLHGEKLMKADRKIFKNNDFL